MLGELRLNVSIAEGQAIARQDLRDAKAVATALRVKSGEISKFSFFPIQQT
jgi:hypothetical protein